MNGRGVDVKESTVFKNKHWIAGIQVEEWKVEELKTLPSSAESRQMPCWTRCPTCKIFQGEGLSASKETIPIGAGRFKRRIERV